MTLRGKGIVMGYEMVQPSRIAPRPNTAQERRAAALTCARAALEQPCPHADLVLLLDALNLWEDE